MLVIITAGQLLRAVARAAAAVGHAPGRLLAAAHGLAAEAHVPALLALPAARNALRGSAGRQTLLGRALLLYAGHEVHVVIGRGKIVGRAKVLDLLLCGLRFLGGLGRRRLLHGLWDLGLLVGPIAGAGKELLQSWQQTLDELGLQQLWHHGRRHLQLLVVLERVGRVDDLTQCLEEGVNGLPLAAPLRLQAPEQGPLPLVLLAH
mmetsp:Transcript_19732/g.57248  ORF Transcript_19732/g.57248 Transcript_19732/m.57248 type:complete len:205 (+) Transcript_19732:101-715(+)